MSVDVTRAALAAWSPADTTTIFWVDAVDAGTITSSGGVTSEWRDKSGNARHVAASGSAQPTRGAVTLNGLDTIEFNGRQVMTRGDSLGLIANPGFVAIMVSRPLTSSNSIAACSLYSSPDSAGKSISLNPSDGSFRFNNGNGVFNSGNANGSAWMISTFNRPSGGAYNSGSYRENGTGVSLTSSTNPTNTPNITSPYAFGIGNQILGTLSMGWNTHAPLPIAEFLFLQVGTSLSVIERVEGYLAWKWGLVSSLAADHPYKSAAP